MSTIAEELTARERAAQNTLAERGWTQGEFEDGEGGAVCLHGAVRFCAPQNGDEHIITQVLNRRGFTYEWNDDPDRSADEVPGALSADVTDEELAQTFGPQWAEIVALVRRAALLTHSERMRLHAAWHAASYAAWDAAWAAARSAAWYAARSAAWDAAWDAAWYAARYAAGYAAGALSVRDLIGQYGFTQEHYDTITEVWRKVIGHVHPEDGEL